MTGFTVTALEVPNLVRIDGKVVDLSYGNDLLVDVDIVPDFDGSWAIETVYVYGSLCSDGFIRNAMTTMKLQAEHELCILLREWIMARCSDMITEKWEAFLADTSARRADARREAMRS